ncbi:protein NRT1/ PTR FAMILY 5.2 isoform X2 [Zea mays]|uniref:Protein NRT1/ PTR FAMILY 5.2 n=1 Tax=Zea mays TaxID=4577 RepID=A0A1D6KTR5_MAIZE|nr:protein NRT1/ PTR FAMILY 5.2 isoform X2 [Zea mays]ONM05976.1 Protein NRT1/ PTR FAMILY 5.2 [Zea mays]|eukprot:XP_008664890.1 protein NRT1/ PTR FAMILY 5.2 isoform X2 [Zea mays]
MAERLEAAASDEYTQDGTVDLHGNPVLRSRRGGWRACGFVVVYEVFERMAYYGISSNLVLYLTKKMHQGVVPSANNVTNWVGTIWMTPIIGAYVADAHLGRYRTFMVASVIYLSGMILLTLAVSLPALRPPKCGAGTADPDCVHKATSEQLGVFFLALYILAVGTGGTKPNISTIGADQFDDAHPRERAHKLSFFNWWMFSIFFGTLFANTVLVYIQDTVGWAVGYALPTLGLAVSIAVFTAGTPFYRHKPTSAESPFAKMARVIVAAARKLDVPVPVDPRDLHELDAEHYAKRNVAPLPHTPNLSVLSKAAVKTGAATSRWSLSTVTQVEETKQMLKMLPVLAITFVPSAMMAQINTLFVKQGTTLDRHVGRHFEIPPASLQGFVTISMLLAVVLYDRAFMPFARRVTANPRGISLLQRMSVGLVIHILIMAIASLTERHRLAVARDHGLYDSKGTTVPLTIFVLLPQFVLMGVADAFLEVAKIEFFYDQAPEGMKSLGTSYAMTSLGIGNFLSSALLSAVSHITRRHGRTGWILNNLNASRLDKYYAFFAILNCANLVAFFFVCRFYVYNAEVSHVVDAGSSKQKREVPMAMQPPAVGAVDATL